MCVIRICILSERRLKFSWNLIIQWWIHSTGKKSDWQRRENILPAERNDISSWATAIKTALSTVKRYKKGIIREKNYNFPELDEDIETRLFNKTKEHSISVPGVQVRAQTLSPWEMAPPARLLLMGGEGNRANSQPPCHPITAMGNAHTHCLSLHPFPQSLPSEAGRSSPEVSTRSHFPLLGQII